MTVIVAAKKKIGNRIATVWGADSLITRGSYKVSADNSFKFIEYEYFTVLMAGLASLQHILEDFKKKKGLRNRKFMKMQTQEHVHAFMIAISKLMKERLEDYKNDDNDSNKESTLLIVTPKKIYYVDGWAFIEEYSTYSTAGSGGDFAEAVLLAGLNNVQTLDDLKKLVYSSIEVAINLNTSCGPPIIVKELKTK